jgi:DNA segregation ATPase FtsK/SpoIIIE, S-DNA-T family
MPKKSKRDNSSGKRKSGSKSSKQNGLSKVIFSRGFLIFLLVIIAAALVFWFWPRIVNWYNDLANILWTTLGLGLVLSAIYIIACFIIMLAGKASWLATYWRQFIGGIFIVFFLWSIMALVSDAYGGRFGLFMIGLTLLQNILVPLVLFFFICLCFAPRLVWAAITRLFKSFWWIIKNIFILIFKGIKKLFTRGPAAPKEEKRTIPRIVKPEKEKEIIPQVAPEEEKPTKESKEREKERYQPKMTPGGWQLPPITILDKVVEPEVSQSDVEKRAELITDSLASYGVDAKVVQINVGPTVTQFGVEPGWDIKYKEIREKDKDGNVKVRQQEISRTRVKVEKISSLANDLSLALAASSVRIEAPVPGKSIVGIEVPNTTFGSVNLRSIIESTNFQKTLVKSKLAIPLGKGAGGEVMAADLAKMPHLLIAGSTGSGKTVFINSIICCLLFNNTPDDLKFIMIDPKRVELVNFNSLPQLIAPVVVDADKAVMSLRWLVDEMDRRYKKFADAGARNIDAFNKGKTPGEAFPYIVLVIDELADLMMTAFGEVEQNLCRLAQLSRATGIHLIVATQRPSVDVITGLIKANFPTRISFSLTSQIDSRTILDTPGAEKLLGRGDMLYMPTDASKPKRLQGPFLSDAEIDRLEKFWGDQSRPELQQVKFEDMESQEPGPDADDAVLEEARQLAAEHNTISTSFLQRKLKIGYPRAARIMEKLKDEGY